MIFLGVSDNDTLKVVYNRLGKKMVALDDFGSVYELRMVDKMAFDRSREGGENASVIERLRLNTSVPLSLLAVVVKGMVLW